MLINLKSINYVPNIVENGKKNKNKVLKVGYNSSK